PHVRVRDIGPQQRREDDGKDDQETSHRGGSGLGEVPARTIGPDMLAQPHLLQLANEPWGHYECHEKGRHGGIDDPEALIAKDVEDRKMRVQRIEPEVQHGLCQLSSLVLSGAKTCSKRRRRDAFTSTTSPRCRSACMVCAAAAASVTSLILASGIPERLAPAASSRPSSPTAIKYPTPLRPK